MIQDLPCVNDGTSEYTFQVDLDEVTFGFHFQWNARDNNWFFDILDVNNNPILTSRRVVVSWFLLANFKSLGNLPAGDLYAYDTSGQQLPPGILDLGPNARVRFQYYEAADIAALAG